MESAKKYMEDMKGVTDSFAKDIGNRTKTFASDVSKIVSDSLPIPSESKEHLKKASEELKEAGKVVALETLDKIETKVKKAKDSLKDGRAKRS